MVAGVMLGALGCRKQVRRLEVDKVVDLSGRFNDTDSRFIAESIVSQLLTECGDLNYLNAGTRVLAVGSVRNLSHEHIDCSTFMNDIERYLINSGRCRIVANKSIRDEIRNEMDDLYEENMTNSMEHLERCAKKLGVNRMIFGSITSIIDKEKSRSVKFYQFDIRLVDITTKEVLWMGTKKIKKYIKD